MSLSKDKLFFHSRYFSMNCLCAEKMMEIVAWAEVMQRTIHRKL